ncbi:HvfC/BufC N-terminal domain-containing protein [Hypericibacter sp.]|uniref:HvfC/BufC N-terminal domain-containing protein n=1 Tax=Hypericibacter sp. TaxID=2705401 RepID=UPI003D6D0399
MRLHDLQQAMAERVLDRSPDRRDGELLDHIDGLGLAPSQRLQIYRNNCLISLTEALKATFPVMHRLVGDSFFRTAATAFIKDHPPREPRLAAYGAAFADFIAHYPPAASLIYLADMARLEWALNRAWHAPDAPVLTPADLAQAAETLPVLRLHPACRLLESPWPIETIWRVHQSDDDANVRIDLDEGGSRLLVYRQEFDVAMAAISRGEFLMLARLATGATLESALTEALEADPALDVAAALAGALTRGCLIQVTAETSRQT